MKVKVVYVSDPDNWKTEVEEIDSLEELIELHEKKGHSLTIDTWLLGEEYEACTFRITVNDDYL